MSFQSPKGKINCNLEFYIQQKYMRREDRYQKNTENFLHQKTLTEKNSKGHAVNSNPRLKV